MQSRQEILTAIETTINTIIVAYTNSICKKYKLEYKDVISLWPLLMSDKSSNDQEDSDDESVNDKVTNNRLTKSVTSNTSTKLITSVSKPPASTTKPATSTTKPAASTSKTPASTSKAPSSTSTKPAASTSKTPATTKPAASTKPPVKSSIVVDEESSDHNDENDSGDDEGNVTAVTKSTIKPGTCPYKFKKGNTPGTICGEKLKDNKSTYCSKHKKYENQEPKEKKVMPKPKSITQVKPQTQSKPSTSVRPTSPILKHNKNISLCWHEPSCMVFNSPQERVVIGKCVNDKVVPLTNADVETCEKLGFNYDKTKVGKSLTRDKDDSESNIEEEESGDETEAKQPVQSKVQPKKPASITEVVKKITQVPQKSKGTLEDLRKQVQQALNKKINGNLKNNTKDSDDEDEQGDDEEDEDIEDILNKVQENEASEDEEAAGEEEEDGGDDLDEEGEEEEIDE